MSRIDSDNTIIINNHATIKKRKKKKKKEDFGKMTPANHGHRMWIGLGCVTLDVRMT
jgi:hypothetical protein